MRPNCGDSSRSVHGQRSRQNDRGQEVEGPRPGRAAGGLVPPRRLLLGEDQREELQSSGAPELVIQEERAPGSVLDQLQTDNLNGQQEEQPQRHADRARKYQSDSEPRRDQTAENRDAEE